MADITIYQGEDRTIRYTVYQSDGETVQDVTGWTLSFDLRETTGSETTTLTLTTAGGAIVLYDAVNGLVDITITRAQSQALSPMQYAHGLARTNAGFWTVLDSGNFTVQEVSVK